MDENQYTKSFVSDGAPHFQQGSMQMQKPPRPDSYLIWAILTTCMCCLPFGIYAIIQAAKVENLYNMGDYDGAYKASNDAKKWSIISAIAWLIVMVIYVLLMLLLGAMSNINVGDLLHTTI